MDTRRRSTLRQPRVAAAITLGVVAAAMLVGGWSVAEWRARAAARTGSTALAADAAVWLGPTPGAAAGPQGGGERARLLAAANELQQVHRFGAAEALLSDWLARTPGDARVRLVRSQLRIHGGNPRGALADCMAAARVLDALAASACVAQARGALGDVRGARLQVEAALASGATAGAPESATVSWAAGIAAELADRDGDDASAERWHRRSVELAGTAHYPPLAYADFLLARGRAQDALRLLAPAPHTPEVQARRTRAEQRS